MRIVIPSWPGLVIALSALILAALPDAGHARNKVPRDLGPVTRQTVAVDYNQPPGTIVISNSRRTLDFVLGDGTAHRYRIGIGREGFEWTGVTTVGRKGEWPDWRPPDDMRQREPDLPEFVPAGPFNPLGARAIYLFRDGRDTLYRIHGTNDNGAVGRLATSGCFRMTNADVIELYTKVKIGTKVVVND